MYLKKGILVFAFLMAGILFSFSQAITVDPELPTDADEVTVTFDATKASRADLVNYSGDIYAHTGVKVEGVTDWQYVIGDWGDNTTQPKLTRTGTNTYTLSITPSIREFYGVPAEKKITQLCFVFRNSDGSKQTEDIFYDVYEKGLNVNISSPKDDDIIVPGESINIIASSNDADSMFLYIDDVLIKKLQSDTINYTHSENIAGSHNIKVIGKNADETAEDSVYFFVRGNNTIADLPEGWIKGINYLSDDSVGLVLFAPNKQYVFAIGDFSDWRLDEKFMMNRTPNDSIYWVGIGSLTPEKEYIFQYYIDGELRIADPYTEKTSDPNDKYISNDTYPNLIQYPEGKTTHIASVLQTGQGDYAWKHDNYEKPDKQDLIIYELLVRDFIANHDYKTLTDTLNYLDSLGINAIELMPVSEFEGNESWGYNPSFYFAPDKYYGPKNDLKAFIDSCHSRGIAVIMDMVLNHSYGQSPLVRMYFDSNLNQPTADNPWYNTQSPNSTYSWGYDFNHESEYTKEFVDSVTSYWLEKYKMDGFRFDFTKGFTNTAGEGWAYDASRIAILKRMADKIWDVNSSAYVILEHFTDNTEEKELSDYGMLIWGNINGEYINASVGNSSDISWGSYKERGWTSPSLISYMESHDEERLMYKNLTEGNSYSGYDIKELETALQRIELAANFFIPIPGPKMIWQFGELGYDISINYDDCRVCNKPIHWEYFENEYRNRLYKVFKILNELKQKYNVFLTSDYSLTQEGDTKELLLNNSEMDVVVIGNFDLTTNYVNTSFPHTGDWYELYTGDTLSVNHSEEMISLKAGEYRLYTDQKLEKPDILTSTSEEITSNNFNINVYPNPSSDIFYFEVDENVHSEMELSIYDIQGRLVCKKSVYKQNEIQLDASNLNDGVYFYKVVINKDVYSGKILKK